MIRNIRSDIKVLNDYIEKCVAANTYIPIASEVVKALENLSLSEVLAKEYQYRLEKECLPNCLDCGACCRHDNMPADTEGGNVPEHMIAVKIQQQSNKPDQYSYMAQTPKGICIAFELCSGKCSIYKDRPLTCKEFSRGSPQCIDSIQKFGLNPERSKTQRS